MGIPCNTGDDSQEVKYIGHGGSRFPKKNMFSTRHDDRFGFFDEVISFYSIDLKLAVNVSMVISFNTTIM